MDFMKSIPELAPNVKTKRNKPKLMAVVDEDKAEAAPPLGAETTEASAGLPGGSKMPPRPTKEVVFNIPKRLIPKHSLVKQQRDIQAP